MNTHLLIAAVVWLALIFLALAWKLIHDARDRRTRKLVDKILTLPFADTAVSTPVKIEIVQGDIATEHVDAIVNAAKSSLLGGAGVDGAIHRAGGSEILEECKLIREHQLPDGLPVGKAVVTTAGKLPATMVVHTVGPVYDWRNPAASLLRSCYTESLRVAEAYGARSVAFPLISSGVYGWPVRDAVRQALVAIRSTPTKVEVVRLVLFDERTYAVACDVEQEMA